MTKEEMRALVDKLNDYTKAYDEGASSHFR